MFAPSNYGQKMQDYANRGKSELPLQNSKTFGEMSPQDKKTMEGSPLPKQDPSNPESQFEYLLGIRMTKTQKWAVVIGVTLGIYGFAYYLNKKH